MSAPFAAVLHGLMANRRLGPQALSRASGRAESTVNQLLAGTLQPTADVLQDIAPALEMTVADLLVIAGLPINYELERPGPWRASQEIGSLLTAATWLTPAQVEHVTALARKLRADNR
ncbi:helix-turn-helix domain-containing protein [Micromonospora musae]|uniref:helix-turn-helix domain-containing protein n=1 Tax=Micromonospora musae TaxID=1894970 RepID=UPI00341F6138